MQTPQHTTVDSPMALVAIIRAARTAGDRELERAARQLLRERYQVDLVFRGAGVSEEAPSCRA